MYWSHPLPLFPRGGVYPSPYPLPRTQDPGWGESLGILIATFLAISLLFFFASFFDAFLGRSWLRFPSQLASQNRPKSKKNRCQDAIHLGLRFLIDFWSVLALNFHPQILIFLAPAAAGARIIKNRLSKLTSIFEPILVPTWLHFPSQNPPKSFQK